MRLELASLQVNGEGGQTERLLAAEISVLADHDLIGDDVGQRVRDLLLLHLVWRDLNGGLVDWAGLLVRWSRRVQPAGDAVPAEHLCGHGDEINGEINDQVNDQVNDQIVRRQSKGKELVGLTCRQSGR